MKYVVFKLVPVQCRVQPPEVRTDKYRAVYGRRFFRNGRLCFTSHQPVDRKCEGVNSYCTVFGPTFFHEGVIYGNTATNLNSAFSRINLQRINRATDRRLRRQQREFIANHEALITRILRTLWHFTDYGTAVQYAIDHADDPHEKRAARSAAKLDAMQNGYFLHDTFHRRMRVWYKMKLLEIAKLLKVPRTIGDFGVMMSLLGFCVKFWKRDFSKPITIDRDTFRFVQSPADASFREIFRNIASPDGIYFAAFSDDGVYSILIDGRIVSFNVDISKCDTSHEPELFELLRDTAPIDYRDAFDALIRQLLFPVVLFNPEDPDERVMLTPAPRGYTLYSGSVLTTIVNVFAMFLIFLSFREDRPTTVADLHTSAARAGYLISVESTRDLRDVCFLKHLPVLDLITEEYTGLMHPGVLFRTIGRCKFNLPGKLRFADRCREYNAQLVHSIYGHVDCPFVNELATIFGKPKGDAKIAARVAADLGWNTRHKSDRRIRIENHEFTDRYGISECDLEAVIEALSALPYAGHTYILELAATTAWIQHAYSLGLCD